MSVTIEIARPKDADAMIPAGIAAFANDLLSEATFALKTANAAQLAEFSRWRVDVLRARINRQGSHYFKAVDESTGEIVGYAGFFEPEAGPEAGSDALNSIAPPSFMIRKADDEYRAKKKVVSEECLKGRKDVWYVQSMAVHPEYQGRGLAKRLLQCGLDLAEGTGQDIYLEGTAAGQTLYRRCGFQELGEISVLDGQYTMKAMMRYHQSSKTRGSDL